MAMSAPAAGVAAVAAAVSAAAVVAGGGSLPVYRACISPRFLFRAIRAFPSVSFTTGTPANAAPLPRPSRISCQASDQDKVDAARKTQMDATEVLAELLKATDVRAVAQAHVMSLTENFFHIASAYLDMAKKEGNVEVANKLESTLKTAVSVKETTLRPEIRVLNLLLRQKTVEERKATMDEYAHLLFPEDYFFELLAKMTSDVEKQTNNRRRMPVLVQLRIINKETKAYSRAQKRARDGEDSVPPDEDDFFNL